MGEKPSNRTVIGSGEQQGEATLEPHSGLLRRRGLGRPQLPSSISCLYLGSWALHKKLPQPPAWASVLAHFSSTFSDSLCLDCLSWTTGFAFCSLPPARVTWLQMLGLCELSAGHHVQLPRHEMSCGFCPTSRKGDPRLKGVAWLQDPVLIWA